MTPHSPESIHLDHRPLPAWGASVLLHAVLIILAGLLLERVPRGVVDEPARTVGIVLRHVTSDREWFEGEGDQAQEGVEAGTGGPSNDELLSALPEHAASTSATAALRSLPFDGPGGVDNASPGHAGELTRGGGGGGPPGVPGGQARVRVFGAEGVGSSFVYLFDRSASMEGGPLAAAKQELLYSLQSLDATHQFHILFFNEKVSIWDLTGGQGRVAYADERNKELAARFVRGIMANGGTNRRDALLKALDFGPDVLFFLTDADHGMSVHEIDRVTERNGGRTAITCIEFGRGPNQHQVNFLVDLARRNGGEYVYVDIRLFEGRR
jgi:hypothetical protein